METGSKDNYTSRIEELEARLAEAEQLIEAIKSGEVDAFALKSGDRSEIFTLQTGDYAYRILVENISEGALNLTEEGLIVYTNSYFHELLDLSYEKVIGKNILEFIHSESKEKFKTFFTKGIDGQVKGEINLSYRNKTMPVYISLTSLRPQLSTVGMIVTDLSEKKHYEQRLEQKNIELLQSNSELSSFAYIASHDLQEPLRKIQTFANRILSKEADSFSSVSQDFFQRIISASERMQNLINALLSYSRTSTSELVFAPTDLGVLMEEVKNNLHELISESHTTIEISSLPILNVIPLQFQQLFTNLIINSIKYRNPHVNPVIRISSNTEPVTLSSEKSKGNKKDYLEIKIEDNGIGFEKQYADKIFELFQRLHGKNEYEGTGVGLAICKKIVQNHHGFIRAEGDPGVGSIFRIYLPFNS
jgi:PAS domain S-box-containing protein